MLLLLASSSKDIQMNTEKYCEYGIEVQIIKLNPLKAATNMFSTFFHCS
jgi:hypothetical protein